MGQLWDWVGSLAFPGICPLPLLRLQPTLPANHSSPSNREPPIVLAGKPTNCHTIAAYILQLVFVFLVFAIYSSYPPSNEIIPPHSTTLPHIVIQITQKSPQTTKCSQHFAKPCIGSWEAEKISSASTDFLARLSLSNGGTGERAKKGNKFTFFLWIEM